MQSKPPTSEQASLIARVISVLVLVALVVLFGVMFYRVMADFLMPIFLAILMAVLFQPLFSWLLPRCRNSHNLTALVTVGIVLLSILIPIFWLSLQGIREAQKLIDNPDLLKVDAADVQQLVDRASEKLQVKLNAAEIIEWLEKQSLVWVKWLALKTPEAVIGFLFGMTIMLLSLYYFLIDGNKMILAIGRLLPLEAEHQQRLFRDFASVSRAVATATILAALCQGLLAGVGYYLAGVPSSALLTMLTVLAALIPFIGAAIIWVPCCLWLAFFSTRWNLACDLFGHLWCGRGVDG